MKGGELSFDWAVLIPRIVHPLKVAIVEAMLYMERPLSASELSKLFAGGEGYVSMASYHLRALSRAGVLEVVETRPVRGALQKFYYFRSSPNGSKSS